MWFMVPFAGFSLNYLGIVTNQSWLFEIFSFQGCLWQEQMRRSTQSCGLRQEGPTHRYTVWLWKGNLSFQPHFLVYKLLFFNSGVWSGFCFFNWSHGLFDWWINEASSDERGMEPVELAMVPESVESLCPIILWACVSGRCVRRARGSRKRSWKQGSPNLWPAAFVGTSPG